MFVATKYAAEIVADKLRKAGINAEPFHGDLSQGERTQVLADFKASRLKVVVATDVAARGIDIAQLPVVVNYDLPRSAAGLHPPHRPHRPRRRKGPGGELCQCRHRGAFPFDRKAPGLEPAARTGGWALRPRR